MIERKSIFGFRKKFLLNDVLFTESNAIFGVKIFEKFINDCTAPSYERNGVKIFNLVGLRFVKGIKLENTIDECRRITIAMKQVVEMSKDLIVKSRVRGGEIIIFEIHGSVKFHREKLDRVIVDYSTSSRKVFKKV